MQLALGASAQPHLTEAQGRAAPARMRYRSTGPAESAHPDPTGHLELPQNEPADHGPCLLCERLRRCHRKLAWSGRRAV